jgi:hypothetical protein
MLLGCSLGARIRDEPYDLRLPKQLPGHRDPNHIREEFYLIAIRGPDL